MELPLLPSTPTSAAPSAAPVAITTSISTTPTQAARTILSARMPSSPTVSRKSAKKQTVMIDGVEAVVPISLPGGSSVRSVLGTPSTPTDGNKTVQQQIVMGGRVVSSPVGRKSLVMTSSGGIQQVVSISLFLCFCVLRIGLGSIEIPISVVNILKPVHLQF